MKKLFALMLTLCLLCGCAAVAEESTITWADVAENVEASGMTGDFHLLEGPGLAFWLPSALAEIVNSARSQAVSGGDSLQPGAAGGLSEQNPDGSTGHQGSDLQAGHSDKNASNTENSNYAPDGSVNSNDAETVDAASLPDAVAAFTESFVSPVPCAITNSVPSSERIASATAGSALDAEKVSASPERAENPAV